MSYEVVTIQLITSLVHCLRTGGRSGYNSHIDRLCCLGYSLHMLLCSAVLQYQSGRLYRHRPDRVSYEL